MASDHSKVRTTTLVLIPVSEAEAFRQVVPVTALAMQLLAPNANRRRNTRLHTSSVARIVLIPTSQIVPSKHSRLPGRKRLEPLSHTQKACHKVSSKTSRVKLGLPLLQLRNTQETRTVCNLSRRLHHTTIARTSSRVSSTIPVTTRTSNSVNRTTTPTVKGRSSLSQLGLTLLPSNEPTMETSLTLPS